MTASATAPPTSLFGKLISNLTDEELVVAGPDVISAISSLGAAGSDIVAQQLVIHRLAASILEDQVVVKNEVIGNVLGVAGNALSNAIAAAKARLAAPPPPPAA